MIFCGFLVGLLMGVPISVGLPWVVAIMGDRLWFFRWWVVVLGYGFTVEG